MLDIIEYSNRVDRVYRDISNINYVTKSYSDKKIVNIYEYIKRYLNSIMVRDSKCVLFTDWVFNRCKFKFGGSYKRELDIFKYMLHFYVA